MKHITTAIVLGLLLALDLAAQKVVKPLPIEKTQKSAKEGDAAAQFNLGQMYRLGFGVRKDAAKAEEWYRKAALQGLADAQNALSDHIGWQAPQGPIDATHATREEVLRQMKAGTEKYQAERKVWTRKAAEGGNAEAQHRYGSAFKASGDKDEAFKWTKKAAEQRHMWAQADMGGMYATGTGTAKDLAEATKWYRKAAEHGTLGQMSSFGLQLRKGDRVIEDDVEAAKWLRLSAETGWAFSQIELGEMYAAGEGVPKDLAMAYMWLNLSPNNWGERGTMKGRVEKARTAILGEITPEQLAEGKKLSSEWVKKPRKIRWYYRTDPFIR